MDVPRQCPIKLDSPTCVPPLFSSVLPPHHSMKPTHFANHEARTGSSAKGTPIDYPMARRRPGPPPLSALHFSLLFPSFSPQPSLADRLLRATLAISPGYRRGGLQSFQILLSARCWAQRLLRRLLGSWRGFPLGGRLSSRPMLPRRLLDEYRVCRVAFVSSKKAVFASKFTRSAKFVAVEAAQ